jgi:hypothetical protein
MSLDLQFNTINEKLQRVLRQYQRVKKENEHLNHELGRQEKEKAGLQRTISELQQQVAILKLATGDMKEKEKKDFEKQINQYIREIDKCIGYLSE